MKSFSKVRFRLQWRNWVLFIHRWNAWISSSVQWMIFSKQSSTLRWRSKTFISLTHLQEQVLLLLVCCSPVLSVLRIWSVSIRMKSIAMKLCCWPIILPMWILNRYSMTLPIGKLTYHTVVSAWPIRSSWQRRNTTNFSRSSFKTIPNG